MTHLFNDTTERERFLKFAAVGAIGAVVDFAVFNLLNIVFHITPIIAQAFSFSAAVVNNFVWNRHWTYPESRSKAAHHQMTQFTIVNAAGLLIRTPIIGYMEHPLGVLAGGAGFPASAADVIGHNLALALAIGIVMLWNYFINRYWTYNDV